MQDQIKDLDRLLDIQEFCSLVLKHRPDSKDDFLSNEVLKWGIVKALENIGEASYKVSRETQAEFSQLNWKAMIVARHVYVHDYFKIDWNRVWETLTTIDFDKIIEGAEDIINVLKSRFSL